MAISIKQLVLLSPERFEDLVFHTLRRKYPGAEIFKVDGAGGDEGIDTFSGQLSQGPAIWQAKAFSRLAATQRKQIKASFERALGHRPCCWTLCIPVDLRTNEHQWFQDIIVGASASTLTCKLMQGSDFIAALNADTQLRDSFFPNDLLSNALSLRDSALSISSASLATKQQFSVATAESFLENYRQLDPRFDALAMIGGSARAFTSVKVPNSVFQMQDQGLRIDFVPREPTEYALDPLRISFALSQNVSDRLSEALDYGVSISLPRGSMHELTSSSALVDYFFKRMDLAETELELSPILPDIPPISLTVFAGRESNVITLKDLLFRTKRVGRKEVEICYDGPEPIRICIIIPAVTDMPASLNFSVEAAGALITSYARALNFFEVLESSRSLSVFASETQSLLLSGAGSFSGGLNVSTSDRALISDLALIAHTFNVAIRVPESIRKGDLKKIETMLLIITGEAFGEGGTISSELIKNSSLQVQRSFFSDDGPTAFRLHETTKFRHIELFGETVDCGEVILEIGALQVDDREAVCAAYDAAEEGVPVSWRATCLSPMRFLRPGMSGFDQTVHTISA